MGEGFLIFSSLLINFSFFSFENLDSFLRSWNDGIMLQKVDIGRKRFVYDIPHKVSPFRCQNSIFF